jgi:hypothetical protein
MSSTYFELFKFPSLGVTFYDAAQFSMDFSLGLWSQYWTYWTSRNDLLQPGSKYFDRYTGIGDISKWKIL